MPLLRLPNSVPLLKFLDLTLSNPSYFFFFYLVLTALLSLGRIIYLGNLIHKIDNDEFDFLSSLEDEEAKKKREQAEQEAEELKNFRM